MKHPRINQLLQVLKKYSFIKRKKIDTYCIQEVGYFDWNTEIGDSSKKTDLNQGIGGLDSHYQVQFHLKKEEIQPIRENQQPCLVVSTQDTDMWNTNNPQFIVTVNNELIRALDMNHNFFELDSQIEEHDIKMNVYTNTSKADVFIESWVCMKNIGVYELFYQVKALSEVLELTTITDHTDDISRLLDEILEIVDFIDTDSEEFYMTISKAQKYVQKWLENRDQSVVHNYVTEHIVGHTHIDISWLWTLKQTREKVIRSFSNAVYLMEKYPEMTFMSSTPLLYEMVSEESPELFDKIKELVYVGRWEVEGGMYVESDLNLPSGESLIRQIMYGKKYFSEQFEKDTTILWLPDCFGFTASLPQIMKKSGLEYFFTSKLDWNETNKIPNDTFYWQGIDGTKILTHLLTTSDYSEDNTKGTTYNGRMNASQVKGTWSRYRNKSLTNNSLQLYGFGDGGGGPTDEMLEYSRLFEHNIPTMPTVKHSHPSTFFNDLNQDISDQEVPKWVGELYLETHRGVYTTDGRLKKENREVEILLLQVELTQSILLSKGIYVSLEQKELLEKAWKETLINQFHDILPGTSIKSVQNEAIKRYGIARKICIKLIKENLAILGLISTTPSSLINQNFDPILFNPSSFSQTMILETNQGDVLVKDVPPFSYRKINVLDRKNEQKNAEFNVSQNEFYEWLIETPFYSVILNNRGELSKLYDKKLDVEYFDDIPGNQWIIYPDRPTEFDAWNIDSSSLSQGKVVENLAKIEVISQSAYRIVFSITRNVNKSQSIQKMTFYNHTRRIDFETVIDWQETGNLLKVKFSTPISVGNANYGIQFGNIERPTHKNTSWDGAKYEVCAHRWADLSEQAYGIAIISPDKYGYHIEDQTMYLSLLRSPDYPAPGIDKGTHQFMYALYPHEGDFRQGEVYKEAYNLSLPISLYKSDSTSAMSEESLVELSKDNLICEAIKVSESGKSIIIRCFESHGKSTKGTLKINLKYQSIQEVSMIEKKLDNSISFPKTSNNEHTLEFKPYEIKTFKIYV